MENSITFNFVGNIITLHYITLHYITLHYITLHHITSHHITSHHITLHYITLHYCILLERLEKRKAGGLSSPMRQHITSVIVPVQQTKAD